MYNQLDAFGYMIEATADPLTRDDVVAILSTILMSQAVKASDRIAAAKIILDEIKESDKENNQDIFAQASIILKRYEPE